MRRQIVNWRWAVVFIVALSLCGCGGSGRTISEGGASVSRKTPPPPARIVMGRVITVGWEWDTSGPDGATSETFAGSATRDTTTKRSGNSSLRCNSTASNGLAYALVADGTSDLERFYRAYFYFEQLPTTVSRTGVMRVTGSGAEWKLEWQITPDGTFFLRNGITSTDIGGESSQVLQTGRWYKVEMRCKAGVGTGEAELRIDDVTTHSGTSLDLGSGNCFGLQCGWRTLPGASKVVYVDDAGINNTSGSEQNSWLGEGKVVLLRPISDNAVDAGWEDGDGAGTLFGSVDNTPPIGNATPADGTQIRCPGNSTTINYDANLQSYADAGITTNDRITVVQGHVTHTEEVATQTKTGALLIVSNPTQASEQVFTFSENSGMVNYPLSWGTFRGTSQHNPTVTLETSPVLRVGKRSGGSRAGSVCAMGLYVEYQEASPIMSVLSGVFGPLLDQ